MGSTEAAADLRAHTRRSALVVPILRTIAVGALIVPFFALVQAANPWQTVLATYLPLHAVLAVCFLLLRLNKPIHAAVVLTSAVFLLVTVVLFAFGGLMANNAVAFVLVVMLAGTMLGGRAALVFAVAATAVCGAVAIVEARGYLPPSLAPITLGNAWTAIAVTLVLAAQLHNMAVRNIDAEATRSAEALAQLRAAQSDNETQVHYASVLTDIAERALRASDPMAFAREAVTLLRETLAADACALFAVSAAHADVIAAEGCAPPATTRLDDALSRELGELGRSVPAARAGVLAEGFSGGGFVGVPNRSGGVRAALGVLSKGPRQLASTELQLLVTAAGIVGTVLERASADERAERAQKLELVGRLSTGVAHDFNNLLTVIAAASEELRHRDPTAAPVVDDIDHACERATLLTRQLLAFSRKQSTVVEPADVVAVVSGFLPSLRRLVGDAVVVDASLPLGPLTLDLPRGALEQVLLNLVVNAREAMPDGGRVVVRLEREDDMVLLEVTDTGVGMTEATRRQVFEPFFTTKPDGTGLGLATVHDIVARMRGTVDVESAPGRGTTFRVRLPVSTAPGTNARPRPDAAPHGAQPLVVLLVDDHALVRAATSRLLERLGHKVVAVGDAVAALDRLAGGLRCDLVVTDIAMPEISGLELVARLDARGISLPVLMISGHVDEPPLARAAAPLAFLPKPFTLAQLGAAVAAVTSPPP